MIWRSIRCTDIRHRYYVEVMCYIKLTNWILNTHTELKKMCYVELMCYNWNTKCLLNVLCLTMCCIDLILCCTEKCTQWWNIVLHRTRVQIRTNVPRWSNALHRSNALDIHRTSSICAIMNWHAIVNKTNRLTRYWTSVLHWIDELFWPHALNVEVVHRSDLMHWILDSRTRYWTSVLHWTEVLNWNHWLDIERAYAIELAYYI